LKSKDIVNNAADFILNFLKELFWKKKKNQNCKEKRNVILLVWRESICFVY
jgi:hypothetical protein